MNLRLPVPLVVPLALALAAAPARGQGSISGRGAEVVSLPGGTYHPFYVSASDTAGVTVEAFRLDVRPVTVGEFLVFVVADAAWRRGAAPPALVGSDYLSRWDDVLDPGVGIRPDQPVTEVSWFAARAYCRWAGGRLPTTAEWEYAAQANDTLRDATGDPGFNHQVLALYTARVPGEGLPPAGTTDRNAFGLRDLHGLVWEWTSDFNNQTLTGGGREDRGLDRQRFCAAGSLGVADLTNYAGFLRWSYRASLVGSTSAQQLGFRCAR
ncbi:MAG TPA: formylglycine-generating enzyme family protein [Longimicrobiales bacterium]|nr:formylglycine-generating enzyme family protein [Longimicrobiales bacterium]